ncbi:MAG: excinuclease ABC subunit UvrA [Chitinophagaceae bacterium]|nr:excinuclease ABC subunit UvrA [Oligoflexus sp.]
MERVEDQNIELNGVRTHNLKNFSIKFPLGKISVVTGVSGSGKSSLVFDTLYGEAYRRYVESLSSYARQYLKQLAKPDLDTVENLPPAIAVKQARSGLNQRSTVGTMTEMTDVLRIIFGHLSRVYCHGKELIKATGPYMAQDSMALFPGQKLLFLAPLDAWGKLKAAELKVQLEAQGFTRCFVDGEVHKIGDIKANDLKRSMIVVDRITATPDSLSRMIEASELTLRLGRGRGVVRGEKGNEKAYNKQLVCPECDTVYVDPSPTLFNHNHPQGACERCQGFGRMPIKDRAKITPDLEGSIATDNVPPWNFGEHKVYYKMARRSAKMKGYDVTKPFKNYTATEWKWLYEGDNGQTDFDGINGYFAYLDTKRYKAHYRIHAARFTTYVLCDECLGFRLNKFARACQIGNHNFVDVIKQSVAELQNWFGGLNSLEDKLAARVVAVEEASQEGLLRLTYLMKMGLGYLSLSRSARTLSGGEVQRINMARSLGSALTGTLFCLDEPSVGLHVRDSHNLLEVILELRDQGNTIVIVEHENTIIKGAEYLVEIGPGAGHRGGNLVFSGNPAAYQFEEKVWPIGRPLSAREKYLVLKNVSTHNLKKVEAQILLSGLNVVCGVSGSGKTSLIRHTLYPLLAKALGQDIDDEDSTEEVGTLGPADAVKSLSSVHFVSQESIGRSTRSTIATYLGFYDDIRKILATTPAAKALGLTPGFFSFNVPGGRCETCKGLGYVVEDLSFLGEMPVTCSSCRGMQFTDEALSIMYRSRNLHDILQLTIEEAREFFYEHNKLARALDQIIGMGLGYVRLGQNTSSFSGGEAQRLKLLRLLLDAVDRKPCCLIFDEPSTGLSDKDVQQLLLQLLRLRDAGHTVVVVEHHLGLIKAADWLIEVGPEAASAGGTIVFQGPPAGIMKAKDSRTAPFLLM